MTNFSFPQGEKTLTAEVLSNWLQAQAREKSDWKIGTEHEKFLFHKGTFRPVSYEGEQGIGALLEALRTRYDMRPIMEHDNIIGLLDDAGGSITLEPGGQFELSGASHPRVPVRQRPLVIQAASPMQSHHAFFL